MDHWSQGLAERTRNDTPGAATVVHLNNAGCSLATDSVLAAQHAYLDAEATLGGYETALAHEEVAARFYELGAQVIRADADEMGYCHSATHAWRKVLFSLPLLQGATIAFDESIYGGNLIALLDGQRRLGWRLIPIPIAPSGLIDGEVLADVLDRSRVDLLAVTHMPAQSGVVNDLQLIARNAEAGGALTLVDACQSLGHVPIDVTRDRIDAMVFTGRKYLRAPRGTGGYFVRRTLLEGLAPFAPDIQSAEVLDRRMAWRIRDGSRRLEEWERNWANVIGAVAALEYLVGLDASWIFSRISRTAEQLVATLRTVPGVEVRRRSAERGGIVVFDVPGRDLLEIRDRLRGAGVNVMFAGPQNAPLEMFARQERGWLRASVHYFNDESDLESLRSELLRILSGMGGHARR